MNKFLRTVATMVVGLAGVVSGSCANAGAIFLIGSDVIGLHGDSNYINPVMNQLGGTGKILFLNDYSRSSLPNYTAGAVTFDFKPFSFLTSSVNLSSYSAIYADSPGSCCSDPGAGLAASGGGAKIASFVTAGGSLGVGDYQGNAFWNAALGFAGLPGVTSGVSGVLCEDPGVSTASGLAFGFNASYSEGCFVHQTYSPAFWASKGYFALQTDGANGRFKGDWVTMASGFREPGTVPEPTSLALIGIAIAGLAVSRRRQ